MADPSYELIVAAVSGDEQAMERIIQHYEPMIEEQCGGNEEVRQQIISGLVDAMRHYDLNPWFASGKYGVDCEFKDNGAINLLIHYCPYRYGD